MVSQLGDLVKSSKISSQQVRTMNPKTRNNLYWEFRNMTLTVKVVLWCKVSPSHLPNSPHWIGSISKMILESLQVVWKMELSLCGILKRFWMVKAQWILLSWARDASLLTKFIMVSVWDQSNSTHIKRTFLPVEALKFSFKISQPIWRHRMCSSLEYQIIMKVQTSHLSAGTELSLIFSLVRVKMARLLFGI